MDLWSKLGEFVKAGQEQRKIDFKQQIDLSTSKDRAKFAKDVLAMANTPGGPGYLIIGVMDRRYRTCDNPLEYVPGFRPVKQEAFEQQMIQALDHYCNPVPEVEYKEMMHPAIERPIGVVVIPRAYRRPYRARIDNYKLNKGEVYIRRGSHTLLATKDEIETMKQGTGAGFRVLINFGRPITVLQRKQIETILPIQVDEQINVPYLLDDDQPYSPQIERLVRTVPLTVEEWQSLPLLVNIHPFAPAAAGIVALIHGLRGCFPDIVRMRRGEIEWEVVEILCLQDLRNSARHWGGKR